MWKQVAVLKQKQMVCQDDYSIKHTEADETNTKIVNISQSLCLESMCSYTFYYHTVLYRLVPIACYLLSYSKAIFSKEIVTAL